MDRPECSENQQRQATGVRKPPAPAGFFKKGMLYGDSGQSRVVVSARQQHALLHAALNLALKRFFIAPEAAGGVLPGQLLTHACLDVMTLP